jgi:hypothetical protein
MIELMFRKKRDEKRQIAFVRVDGQEFSVGNVPAECDTDQKVLNHLNSREQEIRFVMLSKQYPEADWRPHKKEGVSDLEALTSWILLGCINKIQTGQDEEGKPVFQDIVIERKPLEYRFPSEVTAGAIINGAKTLVELKTALKKVIIG